MQKYKKFLTLFLIFTFLLWIPLLLNFLLIYKADEYTRFKDLVPEQQRRGAIYGPALNAYHYLYKLELAAFRKPAIIALGSSRILPLREQCFTRSFVNCGIGSLYLNQARIFLEELLPQHKPELLLLGVDYWWFDEGLPQPETYPARLADGDEQLLYKIKQPFFWLFEGKLSLPKYWAIISKAHTQNEVTNYPNMGISALSTSDGFRPDGSYVQPSIIFGLKKELADIKFQGSLLLLGSSGEGPAFGPGLSPARMQEFLRIIQFCREHHIELVMYLNPVASVIYQKLAEMPKRYGFIPELRRVMKTLPVEAYDFFDLKEAGSTDCEFVDGFHSGEVTQQKILLAIIQQNPGSILKNYVNAKLLQDKVAEFNGCVLTKFDPARYHYEEIDFLKLGCKKLAHRPGKESLARSPGD